MFRRLKTRLRKLIKKKPKDLNETEARGILLEGMKTRK
ncbi:ORF1 in transposon ISC1395 [Sulfolobus islandicus M.14.25]|uniref:ORF1 in transposon ISC1395 n=1 Tax=Saccharolobus islandicus (strain M.14.25 / Kamchatka \|nr:ORF1 in transposon ISC1395 [Sulfolobus islandicus M.14.25]